jgi:hypothetical protein
LTNTIPKFYIAFDQHKNFRRMVVTADEGDPQPDSIFFEIALVMRGSEDARRTSAYARMMLTTKVRHLDLLEYAGL